MKAAAWNSLLWLCLSLCPLALQAAPALATATIVDGEAGLVREATRHALAEGVRLLRDDIVETTGTARLVRLEFADGVLLDLGPGSRLLLAPKFSGPRARLPWRLHLLRGTAKLTVPSPLPPEAGAFTTPTVDVTGVARSAVFVVQGPQLQAFAESGALALQERRAGKVVAHATLRSSEFYSLGDDGKGATAARPAGDFVQKLPRPFLDTLPARAAVFASREVAPRPLGEIAYAEAAPWMAAEGLRPHFVTRWRPLAQNAAFREGVAANLRQHPEWDRVLHPEKYLPKPASKVAP